MKNLERKMFVLAMLDSIADAVKMLDMRDPDDMIGFSQQLTALGYTMYLDAKTNKKLLREEEILIAQSFNNQMLRGLYDLIDIREEDYEDFVNENIDSVHVCHHQSKKSGGK